MLDYFKIQEAIVFTTLRFKDMPAKKPTLLHSIRCGLMLMNDGFGTDLVVAGVLHDVVEDTECSLDEIEEKFGRAVRNIVAANTKDPTIADSNLRREDLIRRCCEQGSDSLIVKLSDIYDNYLYYKAIDDQDLVMYCRELKSYVEKYIQPQDAANTFVRSLLDKIA